MPLRPFQISCWILGLVAFLQLTAIGTALALREGKPREVVVVKTVVEYFQAPSARPVTATPPPLAQAVENIEPRIYSPMPPSPAALIPPGVIRQAPAIADPVVERLVAEAREAGVQGDNMKSVIKLEEAQASAPDDPNVLYEMAATFESMGVYDKAGDYYLKVYQLGAIKAGSLWKKAGAKLQTGFIPEVEGLASLGVVRTMAPQETPDGTRHGVIVPISVAPGHDFNSSLLETKVHFYEKRNDKVQKAIVEKEGATWLSQPVDWADGEELVEVWYAIPPADPQDDLLYGSRNYYGYAAELYYDGKLLDIRVAPRTLVNEIRQTQGSAEPLLENFDPSQEFDFPDFEPGDTMLPPLPTQ